jgi:hypothetical protein
MTRDRRRLISDWKLVWCKVGEHNKGMDILRICMFEILCLVLIEMLQTVAVHLLLLLAQSLVS